jgi:hypothetical protein
MTDPLCNIFEEAHDCIAVEIASGIRSLYKLLGSQKVLYV